MRTKRTKAKEDETANFFLELNWIKLPFKMHNNFSSLFVAHTHIAYTVLLSCYLLAYRNIIHNSSFHVIL